MLSRGNGADDESTRCFVEGDGEEDHVVGGCGESGGDGSDDAPMAEKLDKEGYAGLADRRKGRDVRSSPWSRLKPGFSGEPLEHALRLAGIRYLFMETLWEDVRRTSHVMKTGTWSMI